ncbi:MepB family protein [Chryseobacterium pennipullorum]|uniref:MepB family protein n=1 Tax=Chryseobacterium pennipullorum TaxID=2258963 RepID=UPI0021CF3605|nr:MepB family protein [Chryseobacterium pennipullorum]
MILKAIEEQIFYPLAMTCSDIEKDPESTAYSGYNFTLTHLNVKFRLSKITPTKTGQFVTLWKRDKYGETVAFDYRDPFDFYIIAASKDQHDGMFIFPKKNSS